VIVCFNRCSICLGEYKEKDVLRIIPTCRHNFHLACLDLWLQKQTTCPICRVSLKELQGAMTSACSIQQLTTVPENSVDPTAQCVLPVCQDQRGQSNSQERNESVEVVIEIRQWIEHRHDCRSEVMEFCRAVDNLVHRNITMFDLKIQMKHL